MPQPMPRRAPSRGVTLVEACIAIAVAAVIVGTVAPSFGAALERRALHGVAAELRSDLHFLRTQSLTRDEPLWLRVMADAAGSCYVVHTGPRDACRCSVAAEPSCADGAAVLKAVHLPANGRVQLSATASAMLMDPVRHTVTPSGTLRIVGRSGPAIHHVVNVLGRVRSCSPAGALPGYAAC